MSSDNNVTIINTNKNFASEELAISKIKELMQNKKFNRPENYMRKYIKKGYVKLVNYLVSKQYELPVSALYYAIVSDSEDMIKYIIGKKCQYDVKHLQVYSETGFKIPVNYAYNYLLQEDILNKKESYHDIITKYLKLNGFSLDFYIIHKIWDLIKLVVINYSLIEDNNILIDLFTSDKVDTKCIDSIIKVCAYSDIGDKMTLFDDIYNSSFYKRYKNKLYNCIDAELPDEYTDNGTICHNVFMCKNAINKEPLAYANWEQAFTDIEKNNIVYMMKSSYVFILDELLKSWEVSLNSFDYMIKPQYPNNPYNRKLFHPYDIYNIIYTAHNNRIKIPFIIMHFIRFPQLVVESYKLFKENSVERYTYLRNEFRNKHLYYSGGNAEDNIEGKWKLHMSKLTSNEKLYYAGNILSPLSIDILTLRAKICLEK